MKNIKSILLSGAALLTAGIMGTSCADKLDLGVIDRYGSGSYWKNEAHVLSYIDGLHKNLRDVTWNHTMVYGEMRGGTMVSTGVGDDNYRISDTDIKNQLFDKDHTGVSNFGDIYGKITNCNLLIARAPQVDMDETKRNTYMAIAYGLRALHYFDLYRLYGGVPMRTDVKVIDGVLDPVQLYVGRSTPKAIMTQIKADFAESLKLFGNNNSFNPAGHGNKVYWNKAATECLAADVYLWSAKVDCYDQKANAADLQTAKQHLKNVLSNYQGLEMLKDFSKVFDAKNKANSEIIFAVRYAEGEATNSNLNFTYNNTTGSMKSNYREDGTPWNDPLDLKANGGFLAHQYKDEMLALYDKEDTRRNATFMGNYSMDANGELSLIGLITVKNVGYINAQGNRISCGDYILYRLPWVYLSLAEIANQEGNKDDMEMYMNLVRERAYDKNWDEDVYGFVASDDFTENELAILNEKTKEFVQEGQRWWDLLRMTYTKGGDALVFHKEATLEKENPLLDKATEAHKVLWPINVGVLNNDTTIFQTPGYGAGAQKECKW